MAYAEAGDPAAPLHLLLLHGLFDHKGTWACLTPHLVEAGCHVVAPDLVGFGDSSKPALASRPPEQRYSADGQVGFLRRFIRGLGLKDLVMVGNSLGGGIALRCLCTPWPDAPRVRGLVLENAAGHAQALPPYVQALGGWPGRLLLWPWVGRLALASGVVRAACRATARRVFYDPGKIPPDLVDGVVRILRRPNAFYACHWAARNLVPDDIASFPERYRDLDLPTLIVWGRQDGIVPPLFALLFEEEIRGSTLRVFDECGHVPHLEYPFEVAILLRDWMRRRVLEVLPA